jgi:putative redox protein
MSQNDEIAVVVRGEADILTQAIEIGPHQLLADELVEHGGSAKGPSPYEYLLVALGTCTSMTLQLYANHKGWPLERVTIRLRHTKVPTGNTTNDTKAKDACDRIEREIELTGMLDDAQRQRLLDIARKCPVNRTLKSEIDIQTRLG